MPTLLKGDIKSSMGKLLLLAPLLIVSTVVKVGAGEARPENPDLVDGFTSRSLFPDPREELGRESTAKADSAIPKACIGDKGYLKSIANFVDDVFPNCRTACWLLVPGTVAINR
jgi:hypothetical protein